MLQDLRHALRGLGKKPGFAIIAVLTLAFGIGVNATVFSMISAFFFSPLEVEDGDELVFVLQRSDMFELPHGISMPDYRDYRDGVSAVGELVAYMPTPVHLSAPGDTPERTWIELVTPNYFATARVDPHLGELFRPEAGRDADPAIALSYRYWQRRFGADPDVVGRPITLNGRAFTVVGVAPERFAGLSWAMAVSAWVPSGTAPLLYGTDGPLTSRGAAMWRIIGRLKDGRGLDEARAEIEVVAQRLAAEYPGEHRGTRPFLVPESQGRPDPTFADFMPVFALVFAGMVGLVLFIACANVANLMLSRSLSRQRDLVLRSALGASRLRLIRLQVTESVLLAGAAGAVGLVLAQAAGLALSGFAPSGDIPVNTEHPWDWRVYAFTFAVSAVAGIATGLWPALKASRFELNEALREGGGQVGPSRHPLRNLLVVGQVTLSLIVLVCAGLFLHSLRQLEGLALGFNPDNLLMMSLDLGMQQYDDPRGRAFLDRLEERAEALPGVSAASYTLHVPFDYGIQITDVGVDRELARVADGYVSASYSVVGHDFLETAGALQQRGRGFRDSDDAGAPRVAVVNRRMSEVLWPGAEALGERFRFGRDGDWIEVVGVVADGRYVMIAEEPRPYFYLPLEQHYRSPITLVVRTATEPAALAGPVRDLLAELDPDLPAYNVRTMTSHLRESALGLLPLRVGATLAGLQGLIGLILAVMGLYAVVSYAAGQRTREIGVRVALGARRRDVMLLVAREGMLFTTVGIAFGLVVAAAIGFGLSRVLYGIEPVDAGVFAGVTALLLGVAALACYLPARRATRVDPMEALRYE